MSHAFDPLTPSQKAKKAQRNATPQLRLPTYVPTVSPGLVPPGEEVTVTITRENGYGEFADTSGFIIPVTLLGLVILCIIGYQFKRNLKWTVEGKPVPAALKGRGGGEGKMLPRRDPTREGGVDVESGLDYKETDSLLGLDREHGSNYGGRRPMTAGGPGT